MTCHIDATIARSSGRVLVDDAYKVRVSYDRSVILIILFIRNCHHTSNQSLSLYRSSGGCISFKYGGIQTGSGLGTLICCLVHSSKGNSVILSLFLCICLCLSGSGYIYIHVYIYIYSNMRMHVHMCVKKWLHSHKIWMCPLGFHRCLVRCADTEWQPCRDHGCSGQRLVQGVRA